MLSTRFSFCRIDGDVQSIFARRFVLANETVTLDIQKPDNVTNGNVTSLIVFAFQYKSGRLSFQFTFSHLTAPHCAAPHSTRPHRTPLHFN